MCGSWPFSNLVMFHVFPIYMNLKLLKINLHPFIINYITSFLPHIIPFSEKVWQGGSLVNLVNHPWFTKLKPFKLLFTINDLLAVVLICLTVFCQILKKSQFAKPYPCQTFLLYGNIVTFLLNEINLYSFSNSIVVLPLVCLLLFITVCSSY